MASLVGFDMVSSLDFDFEQATDRLRSAVRIVIDSNFVRMCIAPSWSDLGADIANCLGVVPPPSLLNSPELRFFCEDVRSGILKGLVVEVMSLVRDSSASRLEREDFAHGSAGASDWELS